LDALEQVVRDIETEFNRLNAGELPIEFAFGGREREEMQACPSIAWDEPDGDISGEVSKSIAGADSIATMQPRAAVTVWFEDREAARNACFLLISAARDIPVDHGAVEFDRYEVKGAGSGEHAALGFQFVLQARVKLPVPRDPIPVTTDVVVQGHTFDVKISDGDADDSDDESVASGARPLP
jgi:hypothetical protein